MGMVVFIARRYVALATDAISGLCGRPRRRRASRAASAPGERFNEQPKPHRPCRRPDWSWPAAKGFSDVPSGGGIPLYFATTLAPKKSGRPADGPEILTPQWLRQDGSPILAFPASEARDLLERLTSQQFDRWATASRCGRARMGSTSTSQLARRCGRSTERILPEGEGGAEPTRDRALLEFVVQRRRQSNLISDHSPAHDPFEGDRDPGAGLCPPHDVTNTATQGFATGGSGSSP